MDWSKILPVGGLAVGIGFLGMFWRTFWSFFQQLRSRIITTTTVSGALVDATTHFCWEHFKATRFGARKYLGWYVWVRKVRRSQLIPLEDGSDSKLFWKGWLPIWIAKQESEDDRNNITRNSGTANKITIIYFRGTLDPDEFLTEVCNEWNQIRSKYDPHESKSKKRHYVRIITGTGDREFVSNDASVKPGASGGAEPTDDVQWGASTHRLIGYGIEDIGQRPEPGKPSMDLLSLTEDAELVLEDIRRWLASEDWYRDRCIPWRRGVGLYGPPGTGKTSFVRAVGEDLDLPVYSYDLRTLRNSELIDEWHEMLSNTPCVALIEDIDAVFHGRKNITDRSVLSFDCLLNCVDGLRRSDGVMLAVTTNEVQHIDKALSRPGRLDYMIEMGLLTQELAEPIIQRILGEYPDMIEEARRQCVGKTGAEVQRVCSQFALNKYWSHNKHQENGFVVAKYPALERTPIVRAEVEVGNGDAEGSYGP